MADEEVEEQEVTVPEMWQLVKPMLPEDDDEDDTTHPRGRKPAPPIPKIGKLMKLLNDIEDAEELEAKLAELDPATGQSLLTWATLNEKFVLVEWLVKKGKRAAFAFAQGDDNQLAIYDKWVETRKELEERRKEKEAELAANPPNPDEEEPEDEEKEPEPTADQLVYEALSEYHDDWGKRGPGLVKLIGELGIYHGARDAAFTKEGLGQTLFPNGDMYTGEYHSNQRHGHGTYYWANSAMLYTGHWRNNVREGIGRMVYPDGGRYLGSWFNDKPNGEGRYTYPDGSSYSGSWRDGVKHGFGTYTFTDASQYIGAFMNGEFVSGEWRMAGGSTRYYGAFLNDVPIGSGVFIFKYGTDASYRQEGAYSEGKWIPFGLPQGIHNAPKLRLVIQEKEFTLAFTEECGALSMETLVAVSNFTPFLDWVTHMNENARLLLLESVLVSNVWLSKKNKAVQEVRLKVVVKDAATGKRLKNTDGITLQEPTTRLMVILHCGDKSVCLLQRSPHAALATTEQLLLPTIELSPGGEINGDFVKLVEPALRIHLRKEHTIPVVSQPLCHGLQVTNARDNVLAYIQHIHEDAMAVLQQRLDDACAGNAILYSVTGVRLAEVTALTSDGVTLAAAARVQALMSSGKLPIATVEAQRPPTPLLPKPEPRPDVEVLLEEERREAAARKAEEEAAAEE